MGDPVILPTEGTLVVCLADRFAQIVCGEGVRVAGRTNSSPKALPDGRTRFTVTSPAGFLHIEDDGAQYRLTMGDAPLIEPHDEPTGG